MTARSITCPLELASIPDEREMLNLRLVYVGNPCSVDNVLKLMMFQLLCCRVHIQRRVR